MKSRNAYGWYSTFEPEHTAKQEEYMNNEKQQIIELLKENGCLSKAVTE